MLPRRLADLAVGAEPLLLLLLVPALPVPQKLLYLGLVIPPAIWLCAWLARGHLIPRTPVDWAMTPLLALIGLSHLVARDGEYSLPKVVSMVWGVIAFYLVVRYVHTERRLRQACLAFLILGVWVAALGLFATRVEFKIPFLAEIAHQIPDLITPLWGFTVNPNNIGGALTLILPLQLVLVLHTVRTQGLWPASVRERVGLLAHFAALLVGGFAALLTQSRGAWLGLIVALVTLAAWRVAARSRPLAVSLYGAALAAAWLTPEIAVRLAPIAGAEAAVESVLWRHELWQDVLRIIRDYPLTGLGIVRLREVLPLLYPASSLSPTSLLLRQAHNQLLEVAVSFGLPALVAFGALWLGAGAMLVAARRQARAGWNRAVVEGLSACLTAHFVFGLTESVLNNPKVGIVFWLAFGLAAAASRVVRAPALQP